MAAKFDTTIYPGNIINGEFVPTPTTRHSIDPSTEEPLYEVPVATKEQLDLAVKHARTAFKKWSQTTHEERSKLIVKFADAIEANHDELERLQTMEQGKPLSLAKQEMEMTITWLRTFATMEVKDELIDDNEERTITSTFPPLGVVGAIVPWNWPMLLGMGKVGPALMTGNVIIMKPSPFTPYCDLKLGELGMSIFPPGVFQVLSGDNSLGPWMTAHPGIDMISFTGSIATGKKIAEGCSKTLKRVVLELGGNDAAIVCEDVDIPKCLPKLAILSFLNSGQICMLTKRIYVHEKIYDQFRDAMVEFTKNNVKTGGGFEEGITVGPVQNSMQYDLVKNMYEEIDKQGWKVALEGKVRESSKGYLIEPVIIDNPPEDSRIVVEEPFGPIVPLLKWSDEADVLDRANALETGLGASVWSKDLKRAERMARQLSAGSVWVNSHFDVAPNVPYGGHKESGIGSEWGIHGFKNYTNSRSLWVWKKVFEAQASVEAESPDGHKAGYHGPTSALYDDSTQKHGDLSDTSRASNADPAWMRCTLVVETSKQRQLEPINFSSNRLDFDGVDPELGMQLLSLYWSRQLHAGLLVYRPAFMRDMACGGPCFSKLLLNAMYYSVSKHSPNESIRREASNRGSAGWLFRQRFKDLLNEEFDKSSIATIQALLIMASSLFTRCDERSLSWLYAGNAFNMLTDMGLHVWSAQSRASKTEESEIHTRVFWAAYMIDKIQCLYQGRHPSLRIADTNTSLVFHDDYEELEKFDDNSFARAESGGTVPSFRISTFTALCQLCIIMERIHTKIYAVSYLVKTSDVLDTQSNSLHSDLKAWRKNLPPHIDFMVSGFRGTPLPYHLSMLALYNVLIILTHRLVLSEEESNPPSPTRNTEAFMSCMNAANEIVQILQVYERHYNPSSATFALSYATYISAKVHVHALSHSGGTHPSSLDSLRVCLGALDQHRKLYSASTRAKEMITKLMDRLGVRVGGYSGVSTPSSRPMQTSASQTVPEDSIVVGEQGNSPSTHEEPSTQSFPLNFDLNTEGGLNGDYGNMPGLDQMWLSASQFMVFDDLYYEGSQ
ncbi:aldehyde dehydrogenase [Fusarium albosuccineum]|uniref:aldehyde dehydrogenase (NAD(+)) n=1 Tax=Fusarium albosuccineum TaxID=1237068 RepID=A0A8H4L9P5_9HYPO|nr:aldehyde dehydrogenase [Fusarium albosuccineum]